MQSRKRRLHKFTALLLSIIMCISLLPTPAFAGKWTGGGGQGTGEYRPSGNGEGAWKDYATTALRVTMVAYEEGYTRGFVVGTPMDIVLDDNAPDIQMWFKSNIFNNQMEGRVYRQKSDGYTKGYAWVSTKDKPSAFYDTNGKLTFPRVSTSNKVKGTVGTSIKDYFLTPDGQTTIALDTVLELYIQVAKNNKIPEFDDIFSIEDFNNGFFKGEAVWYVAYLEPVLYFDNYGDNYALTLREILSPMNDLANPNGGNKPGDIWYDAYTATLNMADGMYVDTDIFQDNLKLTKYSQRADSISKIDKNSAGLAVLQVTPEDAHSATVSTHINIFMDSDDTKVSENTSYSAFKSTSIDYIGEPLYDDIANKLAAAISRVLAVLALTPRESDGEVQIGIRKSQQQKLKNEIANYGIDYDTAYDITSTLLSNTGAYQNPILDSMTAIDRNNTEGNIQTQIENMYEACLVVIDSTFYNTIASTLDSGNQSWTRLANNMADSKDNGSNYSKIDGESVVSTNTADIDTASDKINSMRPVGDVQLTIELYGNDSYGNKKNIDMQLGLLRDFIESSLSREVHMSRQSYGLSNGDMYDPSERTMQYTQASELSNTLMEYIGWGRFDAQSANTVITQMKELYHEAATNGYSNTFYDTLFDTKYSVNVNETGRSQMTNPTYSYTLAELSLLAPELVFAVLADKDIYKIVTDYAWAPLTQNGLSLNDFGITTNDAEDRLKLITMLYSNMGLLVPDREAYKELVDSYNILQSLLVIKPITRNILESGEITGTEVGVPVYWDNSTLEDTEDGKNLVMGYAIDELALSNALKAALKILRRVSKPNYEVKTLNEQYVDSTFNRNPEVRANLLDLTGAPHNVAIKIRTTKSSGGTADIAAAAQPQENKEACNKVSLELRNAARFSKEAGVILSGSVVSATNTAGKSARAANFGNLNILIPSLVNAAKVLEQGGEEFNLLSSGYGLKIYDEKETSAADRIAAYSVARMIQSSKNVQSNAEVNLDNKTLNLSGEVSLSVTLWAPAIYGDTVYIQKADNKDGYEVIGVKTNSLQLPTNGVAFSSLDGIVLFNDKEYKSVYGVICPTNNPITMYAKALIDDKMDKVDSMLSLADRNAARSLKYEPGYKVAIGSLLRDTTNYSILDNYTSKEMELSEYATKAGGTEGEARIQQVVLVEELDIPKPGQEVIQYNILTDKNNIDHTEGPIEPKIIDSSNAEVDTVYKGGELVEWVTGSDDTNPSNWSEIPSSIINRNTNTTVPITDDTTVIYVHYKENPEPQQAVGAATLSEKRITGSKLLSQVSTSGLLSNDFKWQSAGTHGCSCHCGGCGCLICTCNCGGGSYSLPIDSNYDVIIRNLNESNIGVTQVVASTSTGRFAPTYDNTSNEAHNSNAAWSGGSGALNSEYYINLFRGKDLPTIASYANLNNATLPELGITSGKSPTNTRFTSNLYTGNIDISMDTHSSSDLSLTYACAHGDGAQTTVKLSVTEVNYTPSISVQTYLGTANKGQSTSSPQANTGTFKVNKNGTSLTVSSAKGTPFTNTSAFKFYPYVEMIAESWDGTKATQQKVNVLGGHESIMAANDFVDIGYITRPAPSNSNGLIIDSTQWSSHTQSVNTWGKDVVLPGGAIYTLKTPENYNTDVVVSMWLNMLDDDTITNAATNNPTAYSRTSQLNTANAFLNQVEQALDTFDVVQHLMDGKVTDPATILGATGSNHVIVGMAGGTPLLDNQTMTNDAKYFLMRNTERTSTKTNEADLDILATNKNEVYYAIWADINGNVYVGKGNSMAEASSSSKVVSSISKTQTLQNLANTDELRELDAKTKLITNFLNSIDRNQGNDPDFGGTWYNEAWRPVYICRYDTIYTIGFKTPTARTAAIDTHLEPSHSGRGDMLTDANSSVFAVNTRSTAFARTKPIDGYIGTFKGADLAIPNVAKMYVSKVFYIPNASVTDLVNY